MQINSTQTPPKILNPLSIIVVFVTFAESIAGLAIVQTTGMIQGALTFFVCVFPVLIASAFFYILYHRPENFYAPKDFVNDKAYLDSMKEARLARIQRYSIAATEIKDKIVEEVRNLSLRNESLNPDKNEEIAQQVAQRVSTEVSNITFITIDISEFDADMEPVILPAAAYGTMNELTNEVYFMLPGKIRPFAYGYDWVLRDKESKKVFKNKRMIDKIPPGVEYLDQRSLQEVGIHAGMTLEVAHPKDKRNV